MPLFSGEAGSPRSTHKSDRFLHQRAVGAPRAILKPDANMPAARNCGRVQWPDV
jgi:hypothetical protein